MKRHRAWLVVLLLGCGGDGDDDDSCMPDDADGVASVDITVALTVDDSGFAPAIVKTQNLSNVTLTLTNKGTKPHGFAVDCLPTPNARGCPTESCFPAEAAIAAIAPGTSSTTTFKTPSVEGIYTYRSSAAPGGPGDGSVGTGQFVLQ